MHRQSDVGKRHARTRSLITLFAASLLFISQGLSAAQFEFNLSIDEVSITVAPGLDYKVFAFNQQVPGPLMHVREGDDVTVHVTNNTSLPHTIHWHGLHQVDNWRNDGVPGITQQPMTVLPTNGMLISPARCGITAMSMSMSMSVFAVCGVRL